MKKLYWRMYQDKKSTEYASVILTEDEMKIEIDGYFKDIYDEDELPPVFEPVMMEEKEFKKLPECEGF
jgi:hypothetical protein